MNYFYFMTFIAMFQFAESKGIEKYCRKKNMTCAQKKTTFIVPNWALFSSTHGPKRVKKDSVQNWVLFKSTRGPKRV